MNASPSRYGGIAAVHVFGIGLLLTGRISAGLFVLAIGSVAFALSLPPEAVTHSAIIVVVAACITGLFLYHAVRDEVNGVATHYSYYGRRWHSSIVTKAQSPEKFRDATNWMWAGAVGAAFVGTIFYRLARKADDWDLEI